MNYRIFILISFLFLGHLEARSQTSSTLQGNNFFLAFIENNPLVELKIFVTTNVATANIRVFVPTTNVTIFQGAVSNGTREIIIASPGSYLPSSAESIENKGIQITSDATISINVLSTTTTNKTEGAAILPLAALGKVSEYYVASYSGIDASNASQFVVVATEDATDIKITPKALTSTSRAVNDTLRLTLNRGQSVQMKANGTSDLSGSIVTACKPVAVFSGTGSAKLDNTCSSSNHLFTQLHPVSNWGNRYLAIPLAANNSNYILGFVGADNGTTITIDSSSTFTVNQGQIVYREYNKPVTINGSGFFAVAQYQKSDDCDGIATPSSNASLQMLMPMSKPVRNAVFSSMSNSSGLSTHYMTIMLTANNSNNINLTINGQAVNRNVFTSFNPGRDIQWARIQLTGTAYTKFLVQSNTDFVAYVHGYGNSQSYCDVAAGTFSSQIVSLSAASTVCPNNPYTLQVSGRNIKSLRWNFGDGSPIRTETNTTTSSNPPATVYTYTRTGTFTILLTVTNTAGCTEDFQQIVTVQEPTPSFSSPVTICRGDSITLDPGLYDAYLWSTGATTRIVTLRQAGNYFVELTQGTCKKRTDFTVQIGSQPAIGITITPRPPSNASQGSSAYLICEDKSETFQLTASASFDSSTESVVWNTGATTNTISINRGGVYTATITNTTTRCSSKDSVAFQTTCITTFFVPTAFSPNGDGKNDQLEIFGTAFTNLDMKIYNRWGELVYAFDNKQDKWDGTINGIPAPVDVYIWLATYESVIEPGKKYNVRGKVTIVR